MKQGYMVVLLLFLFSMVGCTHHKPQPITDPLLLQKMQHFSEEEEYLIAPQDRLLISYYQNPETMDSSRGVGDLGEEMQKGGVLVDAKGDVYLPLVQRVHLAGLTQTQAGKYLTKRYSRFLEVPTIYVEVLNKRIYLLGEVKHPRPITLDREKMTLLEALAYGGGFGKNADRSHILIISRNRKGEVSTRKVNLASLEQLDYREMMLYPNDVVYVPTTTLGGLKRISEPFGAVSTILSPFVTMQYLQN